MCELFASQLAGLVPDNAVIAIDEWTNALRRERSILFAPDATGRRRTDHQQGQGGQDARRAVAACARACGSPSAAIAAVQARVAPGVRQTELTATFLRTIFDAGADANILDPIWQVMPSRMADGPVDDDR